MTGGHVLIALLTGLLGVASLFGAWRKSLPPRWRPVPAGWLLLLASAVFWVAGAGAEFGVSLVLLITSLTAWAFVAVNRSQRSRRIGGRAGGAVRGPAGFDESAPRPAAGARSWLHHLLLFVLVVPLAAVASALLSVAISRALPVAEVDAMAAVIIMMPVLWGAAAYWACAEGSPVRPAAVMVASVLVGAALIYV